MNALEIQAALNAGAVINLPPGPTYIDRPTAQLGNPDRLSDLRLRGQAQIIGDPDGTSRLVMRGGGGTASRYLVDVISGALTIRNVILDGTERENLSEQTHLLHVSAGASLVAEDCTFTLPALGGTGTGGDGIKVAGGVGVIVRRCKFIACDRSGVSVHTGRNVVIDDCDFADTGDADIDIEPPSTEVVTDVEITNIRVQRANAKASLQLTRCARVRVRGANLGGGGVTVISANVLKLEDVSNAGVVMLRRGSSLLAASIGALKVIVLGDGAGIPRGVILDRVTAHELEVESAEGVYSSRSAYSIVTYRAVLCPTFGGHVGCQVGAVYRQPRDKGLPWIID